MLRFCVNRSTALGSNVTTARTPEGYSGILARVSKNFATTQWSLVQAAGDRRSPQFRQALGDLCSSYWPPVYAYIRRRGTGREEAQDLAQGFFSHLLEKHALKAASRQRGRFRSFLLASLKHYLTNEWHRTQAHKRGGGQAPIAMDVERAESQFVIETREHQSPERIFEKRWALTVLDQTLTRLREEMAQSAHPRRSRLTALLTEDGAGQRYKQLAGELDMTESAIKVAVHRMRRRYGELLREEVGRTVDSPLKVDAEIKYLFASIET